MRCVRDRVGDVVQVLVLALDLAEDRVERMLQRAVELVPLRRAQLVEVAVDPLARLRAAVAVAAAEVPDDLLARENRLGDVVQHGEPARTIARHRGLKSEADAAEVYRSPGRRRRRTRGSTRCRRDRACGRVPAVSTVAERRHDAIGRGAFVDVPQHQHGRQQQRRRVRELLAGDVRRAAVHRLEHARSRCRDSPRRRRRGRRPGRRTDPTRCRRTGSAAPARRTAPGSSPAACTPRRRSARRR